MAVPALDHVVVATPDLDETVASFTAATGVAPEPGGSHPRHGTRNYLVSLGDSGYVELIGLDPQLQGPGVDPSIFGLDTLSRPKVATFAVHPRDADAAVAAAQELGAGIGPLDQGSRLRPDGTLLTWRLTRPLAADADGVIPFVIDWGASPSPAETVSARVELVRLAATHPSPASIGRVLKALGTELPIAEGPPGLDLIVKGPAGSWSPTA